MNYLNQGDIKEGKSNDQNSDMFWSTNYNIVNVRSGFCLCMIYCTYIQFLNKNV